MISKAEREAINRADWWWIEDDLRLHVFIGGNIEQARYWCRHFDFPEWCAKSPEGAIRYMRGKRIAHVHLVGTVRESLYFPELFDMLRAGYILGHFTIDWPGE